MKIRLTETQRISLRLGFTLGEGNAAVTRADTLKKLVRLRLVIADADGKGGQLTEQGASVAISILNHPNRTLFDIMSPAEFDQWKAEQVTTDTEPVKSDPLPQGFLNQKTPERPTAAYRHPEGKLLPDDSDLTHASTADLIATFASVMDSVTRTGNTTSLAELSRYAGKIWWEMTGRGVEFA